MFHRPSARATPANDRRRAADPNPPDALPTAVLSAIAGLPTRPSRNAKGDPMRQLVRSLGAVSGIAVLLACPAVFAHVSSADTARVEERIRSELRADATRKLQAAQAAMAEAAAAEKQAEAAGVKTDAAAQFKGINFGIGLGVSADFHGDVVQRVEVINDTVRVTEKKTALPRVFLESHYFIVTPGVARVGIGPFVAIQAGGDEILNAIGAGVMVGWRRTRVVGEGNSARVDDSSFNLGAGVLLDSKAQVLRSGVRENHPVPADSASNLIEETSQWGFFVTFSFTP